MAKRGYKLQELVAHSDDVTCVSIGKKAGRLFITGGDDHQVRLWCMGKPSPLMSLCGLTSPVGSVAFDSAEASVAAGASTGMIKLWDLEEAKTMCTLTGHKASCSAVEFHPFGDFFASGSQDTHLKIWDTRKKGCMHTYKGHSQQISTVKFSPDGRWVVSGGFDNSVKIWDLTAGKVLHEFKSHDGHIRTIAFHPLEFLLATGSADKTVKFWDLETFELIGSSRPEATGVLAMSFHPDGRTLFCGLEDSFKVYSWEPIIIHDAVDMGWSTLADLCIHDDKLLGCSFYRNSVGVWAADLSLIQPYKAGIMSGQNVSAEPIPILESRSVYKQASEAPSSLRSHVGFNDSGTREKTIHVVSCTNSEGSKTVDSINNVVLVPSKSEEYENAQSKKQSLAVGMHPKTGGRQVNKTLIMPSIVPHSNSVDNRSSSPLPISNTAMKTMFGMPLKSVNERNQPDSKANVRTPPLEEDSTIISYLKRDLQTATGPKIKPLAGNATRESTEEKYINVAENFPTAAPVCPENGVIHLKHNKDNAAAKVVNGVSVAPGRTRTLVEKFERQEICSSADLTTQLPPNAVPESDSKAAALSQMGTKELTQDHVCEKEPSKSQRAGRETVLDLSGMESAKPLIPEKESSPQGKESARPISRRESLQAKIFQRDSSQIRDPGPLVSEKVSSSPLTSELLAPPVKEEESSTPDVSESESLTPQVSESESSTSQAAEGKSLKRQVSGRDSSLLRKESPQPQLHKSQSLKLKKESPQPRISRRGSPQLLVSKSDSSQPQTPGKESLRPHSIKRETPIPQTSQRDSSLSHTSRKDTKRESSASQFSRRESLLPQQPRRELSVSQISRRQSSLPQISRRELFQPKRSANFMTQTFISDNVMVKPRPATKDFTPPQLSEMEWKDARAMLGIKTAKFGMDKDHKIKDMESAEPQIKDMELAEPQISDSAHQALSDEKVAEAFMQDHDVFLSTLQSRLTKLQVVRHFWERSDIKGAINAMKKLTDPSVQADVVSVLKEKLEILNLDLFSCLLPLLAGLLDSTIERHTTVSLDLLLKLVAVFGSMIFATASAPPSVGVDLHADERREWCNQCFAQLQNIQQTLPSLIRRGGAVARSAQELNLVLQAS
ncbi:unnamed protein product [Rhodiola kirilowii]